MGITSSAKLARKEERLTKVRVKQLFGSGQLFAFEVGTFVGLSAIHAQLFGDIYDFAVHIRDVNIGKDDFQFAPRMFLEQSLRYINKLPQRILTRLSINTRI